MISAVYRLTTPKIVEQFFDRIDPDGKHCIVRPRMMSVCKADLRYFLGMRSAEIIRRKLPMALIHEAWGEVAYDPTGTWQRGQKVILLPNIPGRDTRCHENYRRDSVFRSSGADGFMREMVSLKPEETVPFEDIPGEIAAMAELISVGCHAVDSFAERLKRQPERVGVWGDGSLGYIVCCLLRQKFPGIELVSVGHSAEKQRLFSMADERVRADMLTDQCQFDNAFECVGGAASAGAISQMIDTLRPEGTMVLLGVSEEPVPVYTRMVLEKGLTLLGRSRSTREDFRTAVELLQGDTQLCKRLGMIISEIVQVNALPDIGKAFQVSAAAGFKTIIDWRI